MQVGAYGSHPECSGRHGGHHRPESFRDGARQVTDSPV